MAALAPAAAAKTERTHLEELQGSWVSVAGPKEARILIAGNRYAFEFVGGDVYIGTFTLAAGGLMDMHVQEGPADHKGQVAPCIYHVENGVLRWCPGRIGSNRRLSAFPSVDDERYLCLLFQKVPKKRK